MTVRRISHLRYLALAVENYEEELEFLSTSWGLSIAHVDEAHEVTYLGAEGSPEPFSVRLRKGEKRIDLIAYGAHSRSDVDALHAELLQAQVQIVFAPKVLDSPGGGYGFRFYDVDGRTIEVSAEVTLKQNRKINPREPVPVKLSHVVVNSTDMQRTADFYIKHLGFAISDTLMSQKMGNLMHFMRCNNAHHSFAVAQGPHFSLHHASFEMRGVEEWMRGSGKILRSGARMVWGPGRHNAGGQYLRLLPRPGGQHPGVHHGAGHHRRRRHLASQPAGRQ